MAETTTTTLRPASRAAATFVATACTWSTSATELPPYFCTTTLTLPPGHGINAANGPS